MIESGAYLIFLDYFDKMSISYLASGDFYQYWKTFYWSNQCIKELMNLFIGPEQSTIYFPKFKRQSKRISDRLNFFRLYWDYCFFHFWSTIAGKKWHHFGCGKVSNDGSEQAVSSPQRGLLFTHNLIGNFKRNYPNCSLVFTFLWLSKARKISAN